MNSSRHSAIHAIQQAEAVADEELIDSFCEADLISDDDIGYDAIAAEDVTGSITFCASEYTSDDEMMAAVEAFVMKCCKGATDETAG